MPAALITMQEMTEELGRLVAARRDAIGMTQEELAARIGAQQSYVSQLEKGKIGLPGIKRLAQISFALRIVFLPEKFLGKLDGHDLSAIGSRGAGDVLGMLGKVAREHDAPVSQPQMVSYQAKVA